MERRALVLAVALTLPLALYAIPYAYAMTTQSTYVVKTGVDLSTGLGSAQAKCSSPLDSTEHYGYTHQGFGANLLSVFPVNSGGAEAVTGDNPNGWRLIFSSPPGAVTEVCIFCHSPITVAGVGVPESSSLYVAIAGGGCLLYDLEALREETDDIGPSLGSSVTLQQGINLPHGWDSGKWASW